MDQKDEIFGLREEMGYGSERGNDEKVREGKKDDGMIWKMGGVREWVFD